LGIAARRLFGNSVGDHRHVANAGIVKYLMRDAALVARALRRAVVNVKARERMLKLRARENSYLAMHEALPHLADEHKSAYCAVVGNKYSCPVCYIRHGQHYALRESRIKYGAGDPPVIVEVTMACDGCSYSVDVKPSVR